MSSLRLGVCDQEFGLQQALRHCALQPGPALLVESLVSELSASHYAVAEGRAYVCNQERGGQCD